MKYLFLQITILLFSSRMQFNALRNWIVLFLSIIRSRRHGIGALRTRRSSTRVFALLPWYSHFCHHYLQCVVVVTITMSHWVVEYTQTHLLDYNIYQMTIMGFDTWLSLTPWLQLSTNDIYNHLYKITSHNLLVCTFQFQLKWQHIQPHLIVFLIYCTPPLDPFNLYGISTFLTLYCTTTSTWFDNSLEKMIW